MDRQELPDECSICLGALIAPCRTHCQHVFCGPCLTKSLRFDSPWSSGACPMCRAAVSLFSTIDMASGCALRQPDVDTIFGSAFLQLGDSGVAAYHFDSPDDCYISYESAPGSWRLDDGSRPPPRKAFEAPAYNAATRTFTGAVRWDESAFGGDARWEYEMTFSESLDAIVAGHMQGFDGAGAATRRARFPTELAYWRARAADSAIGGTYVQGGALGLASYHFEGGLAEAHISYESAPDAWRLDDGTRLQATKPFEAPAYNAASRTFTGTISWGETPFHGDARWEYHMQFSADFRSIVGGQCRAFDAMGEPRATHEFGRALHYARHDEGEAQVRRAVRLAAALAAQTG